MRCLLLVHFLVTDGTNEHRRACCSSCLCLARCLNAKSLGQTKNVNLPGVHVDIMVLTDKDIDDVSGWAKSGQPAGRPASSSSTQEGRELACMAS